MFIEESSKPKEKLKAWYLFTEDFVAGTQHLTNQEIGTYIRLLCWNWNKKCSGIPNNKQTYYRIANCITTDEQVSCETIIKEFFYLVNNHYQNERQLEEWLYITKRIEASKINGRLGGRPKKPSDNPPTLTLTSTNNKNIYNDSFNRVWDKINLKRGSKHRANEEFKKAIKLTTEDVIVKTYNALIYNTEDKKFVPHFNKWLKDKRWEEVIERKEKFHISTDPFEGRIKMFVDAIKDGKVTKFIKSFAIQNKPDIDKGIRLGYLTKEEAIKELGMENEYKR
tara:strand:+ start:819 stop:1661 length:843 start_codon:yes stop_codon:yes gene_type:complete